MRTLKRLVAAVFVVAVVGLVVMYSSPLWVSDLQLHYRMWRGGVLSHTVDVAEGRLRYFEMAPVGGGEGTPLVLLSGLGGRAEDFAALMPRFAAQGFHVYTMDLLGYGGSDKPAASDFSLTTEEHVVSHFMDAVHLQHADVAAWSMGGWIALKLALDEPQRVDRLAVYDSVGIIFPSSVGVDLFAPTDEAGVERLIHAMSPTLKVPPAFVERDIIRYNGRQKWVEERSLASMYSGKDVLDFRLAGLKVPLLLVWGAEDVLVPPSVGEKMHALQPKSVYATVAGCGHFAPVECSAAVAKVSGEFFRAQPAMVGGEMRLGK